MATIYKRTDGKSKNWWCYFSIKNPKTKKTTKFQQSTGTSDKYAAQQFANLLEEEERNKLYFKRKARISLGGLITEYTKERVIKLRTKDVYLTTFELLLASVPADITIEEIDSLDISKVKARCAHLESASWNRYLANIVAMFNWAKNNYQVPDINFSVLKEKERSKPIVYFTGDQIVSLLNQSLKVHNVDKKDGYVNYHFYKFLILSFFSGQRQNEVLNLKVEDVDFELMVLKIKRTKSGNAHYIPLYPALKEVLEKMIPEANNEGYLIHYRGEKISSVKKAFNVALEKCGIELPKNHKIHVIRHTAATVIYSKTNNINLVKEILGHQSIETSMIYTHLVQKNKIDDLQIAFKDIEVKNKMIGLEK